MELRQILNAAIAQEAAANRMYKELAERVHDQEACETLEFLASEELRHRDHLESYKRGDISTGSLSPHQVIDAHLVETLGPISWSPDSKPEEIFLLAAGQEQAAYEFYQRLSQIHPEGEVRTLLMKLAQEELEHKEKMEYLYANTAFPQTDGG